MPVPDKQGCWAPPPPTAHPCSEQPHRDFFEHRKGDGWLIRPARLLGRPGSKAAASHG